MPSNSTGAPILAASHPGSRPRAGTGVGYLGRIVVRIVFARFAARLMRAIREAGEPDELRFDPAEHRIVRLRDGEVVGVMNRANIYASYRRRPRAHGPSTSAPRRGDDQPQGAA